MDNNPYFTNKMNLGERTRKLHDSTTKKDEESMKAGFHGYKSYPEMDKEYSSLLQNKNKGCLHGTALFRPKGSLSRCVVYWSEKDVMDST